MTAELAKQLGRPPRQEEVLQYQKFLDLAKQNPAINPIVNTQGESNSIYMRFIWKCRSSKCSHKNGRHSASLMRFQGFTDCLDPAEEEEDNTDDDALPTKKQRRRSTDGLNLLNIASYLQALDEKLKERDAEIAKVRAENDRLHKEINEQRTLFGEMDNLLKRYRK